MKKEDTLQSEIEEILFEIDFVEKYKRIWEKYNIEDEKFILPSSTIIGVFENLGYKVKKKNKEQYFSDFFSDENFLYRIGISIKYNIVHFDISIKNEEKNINSGGTFGLLVQLMTDWKIKMSSPGFYDVESFQSLIKDLLSLFSEIKEALEIRFRPE